MEGFLLKEGKKWRKGKTSGKECLRKPRQGISTEKEVSFIAGRGAPSRKGKRNGVSPTQEKVS